MLTLAGGRVKLIEKFFGGLVCVDHIINIVFLLLLFHGQILVFLAHSNIHISNVSGQFAFFQSHLMVHFVRELIPLFLQVLLFLATFLKREFK